MKILLINPSIRPNSPKCILNVGLAYVASAIERAGFDLEILDIDAYRYSPEQVEKLIRTKKFDAVGIGTLVSQYKWGKWITGLIRHYHPHVPIMVGNTLGTSVSKTLLEKTEVDIAVLGEGDITAVEVLRALSENRPLNEVQGICFKKDGKIIQTPERAVIANTDEIPFPNYDLFDMEIYLEKSKWHVNAPETVPIPFEELVAIPISTARGCPFRCTFCYHAFQEKRYRTRSPESIVKEMKHWKNKYHANFFNFWDELSFYHHAATKRFAEIMIQEKLGIYYEATCRSELINRDNADTAVKLRDSGCVGLSFSLENGNEEILAAMNKKNHVADFITQCLVFRQAGIPTYTSIVFGYPQETKETIAETFQVLTDAKIYPSVGYLQPMPGTPMFDYGVREGYIKNEEDYLLIMGDRQDLRINMSKALSQKEMESLVKEHLIALNRELKTGLGEEELIKTRVYRAAKTESFVNSFGVAGQVRREMEGLPPEEKQPETC